MIVRRWMSGPYSQNCWPTEKHLSLRYCITVDGLCYTTRSIFCHLDISVSTAMVLQLKLTLYVPLEIISEDNEGKAPIAIQPVFMCLSNCMDLCEWRESNSVTLCQLGKKPCIEGCCLVLETPYTLLWGDREQGGCRDRLVGQH